MRDILQNTWSLLFKKSLSQTHRKTDESFQIKEYYRDLTIHDTGFIFIIKECAWGNGRDQNQVFGLDHAIALMLATHFGNFTVLGNRQSTLLLLGNEH